MALLVHGARLVDCHGVVDDAWVLTEAAEIKAVGHGDQWRVLARDRADIMVIDAIGLTVTPGFVDLHVHGGGGSSFEDGGEAIGAGLAVHRAYGTTRSLVSLVSNPVDRLTAVLGDIAALALKDPLVLGAHLEGPFLSVGRRGAHDLSVLHPPTRDEVARLVAAADGRLRVLTLAPELEGALAATSQLVDAGVRVAVGHTEADYAQATAAFDAGATVLTHAFNAMPGIGHRAPGPVAAAFDDDRVVLELVGDGHHVAPAVVRMTFAAAPGRVALVTDAMAATGAADGPYELGSRSVRVAGGVATLAGTTTLAGSTLTLDRAVRNAVTWGVDPVAVVAAVTSTPARVLGLDGRLGQLRPGFAADLVILDADWQVKRVVADGDLLTR
jgi:N-acetylglucosamine-6-phosphate deacetylase